jgi:hypothetical protein
MAFQTAYKLVRVTCLYWAALWQFLRLARYEEVTLFGEDTWAKVQVYSLALIFRMWGRPHYRSATFQQDMLDNLRNVAIPGSGIPLSVFCHSYYVCMWFVVFANPFVCFLGAVNKCRRDYAAAAAAAAPRWLSFAENLADHYEKHLLHPDDWFSFWRLNCRLTSAQSLLTQTPGFAYENKWKFLLDGRRKGVPVSPFLEVEDMVCKHMNVEGGMGIHFFKNALHGGDWIIQEKYGNAAWLNALLPAAAPLSTMRVITASTFALAKDAAAADSGAEAIPSAALGKRASAYVTSSTAVLRLGRANAATDHSSVLFDVDMSSGRIGKGLDNSHWYRLGLHHVPTCPWLPLEETHTKHPDPPYTPVLGQFVPGMKEALDICVQ